MVNLLELLVLSLLDDEALSLGVLLAQNLEVYFLEEGAWVL